ncbi:MAG: hypothetical protein JWM53_3704, partial [bacterium]|nr:hypothetical protein [bacterium]
RASARSTLKTPVERAPVVARGAARRILVDMVQPQLLLMIPARGAAGQGRFHGTWWIILAIVVFALVVPLAYVLGRNGGKPKNQH